MRLHRILSALTAALLFTAPAFAQQPVNPAAPATRESLALPSIAPLVESIKPAVVGIEVQGSKLRKNRGGGGEGMDPDEFLERFFGGGRRAPQREEMDRGAGSGFIIDPKGLILTNNHVVENASKIRVRLDDGRQWDADVLGRDPLTDVAMIRLRGNNISGLPFVKLGDSDAVKVGDWVVAIGNPLGFAQTVSVGILSARARHLTGQYDDFLQTDAAIFFGNSGGPLFNMKGEVIGINTAIAAPGAGIGFAVPSNIAKALMPMLEKEGSVTRGYLGIGIQDLTPDLAQAMGVPVNEGAIATSVNEGSPAKRGGVKQDDVIVQVDGTKVVSANQLSRTVALKKPETVVTLSVFRAGKPMELKVQLGTRPDIEGIGPIGGPRSNAVDEKPADTEKTAGVIGLKFQDVDPRLAAQANLPRSGALITDVVPGSAAERAELRAGVVVVEASHKPVKSAEDLKRAIQAAKSGTTVLLRIETPNGGSLLRALTIP